MQAVISIVSTELQEQMPPPLVTRMWVGITCAAYGILIVPVLTRAWAGITCAACGIPIVPVFVAVVCLVPVVTWAVRQHRTRFILGLCAIGFGGVSVSAYGTWKLVQGSMYRYELGVHTCMLAAAIYVHHERCGSLPETLEEIRQTGDYGSQAYRFPDNDNGVPPFYLPVTHWDGKAPVVVAVTGRSSDYPRDYSEAMRGYVILGDTGGHFASERELEWILKADDVVRAALGEPKRWESVNWR